MQGYGTHVPEVANEPPFGQKMRSSQGTGEPPTPDLRRGPGKVRGGRALRQREASGPPITTCGPARELRPGVVALWVTADAVPFLRCWSPWPLTLSGAWVLEFRRRPLSPDCG